jgi:hypothetical protein
MTEATLGLKVESSSVKTGTADLDRLTAASKRAEDAAAKLGQKAQPGYGAVEAAAKRAGVSVDEMRQRMQNASANVAKNFPQWERAQNAVTASAAKLAPAQTAATAASVKLSAATGMLNVEQGKADRTANSFINTLTRRFVVGYIITQLRQLVSTFTDLNREIAKTGDVGRLTGLGGQGIQGLQGVAANNGVGSSAFLDDMTSFAREVDQARRGVGDLAGLLRVNGLPAAKDTADAFAKVADLVKGARNDAQRFAILQEAGLPATREYVRLMSQGSDAIRRQMSETSGLRDDQLRMAQVLEDRFNRLWNSFTTAGKRAVLAVANSYSDRELEAIGKQFAANKDNPETRNNYLKLLLDRAKSSGVGQSMTYRDADDIYEGVGIPKDAAADAAAKTKQEQLDRIARQQQYISLLGQLASVDDQVKAKELELNAAYLTSGVSVGKYRDKILELTRDHALGIDSIKAQTDSLNIEAATFGMTAGQALAYSLVQEKINEYHRLGKDLTAGQVDELRRYADAAGAAAQRLSDMRDAAGYTSGFLIDFKNNLQNGQKGWVAFENAGLSALNKISDKLIQMAVDNLFSKAMGGSGGGGGFLGSIFGGLFGGGGPKMVVGGAGSMAVPTFHQGGVAGQVAASRFVNPRMFVGAPRYHNGGLAGDEVPAILRKGEPVFKSMAHARAALGGGSQAVTFNMNVNVQGNGDKELMARMKAGAEQVMAAGIAEYDRHGVRNAIQRYENDPRAA